MKNPIPELRIGDPIRHQSLTVFPLFTEVVHPVNYVLARDADLLIEEVDNAGTVETLKVRNRGPKRALLMEGELLVGAKQDRTLNTSVLVPANSELDIPVSCVEQGRWRRESRHFKLADRLAPPSLRAVLKRSVTDSLRSRGAHDSNQSAVWEDVEMKRAIHQARSHTGRLGDVFEEVEEEIGDTRKSLTYVEDATGYAIVNGRALASLDCFDRPATCRVAWEHAIPGSALDVRGRSEDEPVVTAEEIEKMLEAIAGGPWQQVKAVGEGEEYRAQTLLGASASALMLDGRLVHVSAVG